MLWTVSMHAWRRGQTGCSHLQHSQRCWACHLLCHLILAVHGILRVHRLHCGHLVSRCCSAVGRGCCGGELIDELCCCLVLPGRSVS